MSHIWNDLLDSGFISKTRYDKVHRITFCDDQNYEEHNKEFAIKICEKNIEYIKNNFDKIDEYTKFNNFLIAICFSNDVNIIMLLVDKLNINVHQCNSFNYNCLHYAFVYKANLSIIKYLIEQCKLDINHSDEMGMNYLSRACLSDCDLTIIKYLIIECEVDYNIKNKYYPFICSCKYSTHLEVIKYFIEELKCDINFHTNNYNGLIFACQYNSNFKIIKYLIEEVKINVNFQTNFYENCFDICVYNDICIEIATYLIINTNVKISFTNYSFYDLEKNIQSILLNKLEFIHLFNTLNNVLDIASVNFDFDLIKNLIIEINPLLIHPYNLIKFFIQNPFDDKFKTFKIHVDKLNLAIQLQYNEFTNNNTQAITPFTFTQSHIDLDFSQPGINDEFSQKSELLFEHNNVKYFGNRNIVFNEIIIFKEIKDLANFEEKIILDTNNPIEKYIMNLFIQSTYTKNFNLDKIKPSDILQFIHLIDQYPTSLLSLDILELELIHYFTKHNIDYDCYMIEFINKYGLKNIYYYSFLKSNFSNL